MWPERGCQTNFRWECFTPGMPRRARHKLYVRTGHNFQKTKTLQTPSSYRVIIYVIRVALVLFKGLKQAIEAINIWAFTKLEKYKVSTSPLDGDTLPAALLIWGLVKYSDPQILFEFDYLTSRIPNHHDWYITCKVFTSSISNSTVFFFISKSELSWWWSLLAAKYELSS